MSGKPSSSLFLSLSIPPSPFPSPSPSPLLLFPPMPQFHANEQSNTNPDLLVHREDMSDALDRLAPEDKKGTLYRHSAEGLDDMPAHIKSALVGASVSVPITNGKMNTGTWQGIWYLEFRQSRHSRKVVATLQGEKM